MNYQTLEQMDEACRACTLCPLRKGATQVVPGEGNPHSEIMFIGEGPGATEDKLGRPFVGAAGKFLDELLKSIDLKREDVFIANMVKCRPPQNREPLPSEKETCKPWLDEQIRLINPQVFVPLGRHALGKFLPEISISSAHGRLFKATSEEYKGRTVFAMYHPAVALYNGGMRKTLLTDMQNLKKFFAGEISVSSDDLQIKSSSVDSDVVRRVKEILNKKAQENQNVSSQSSGQTSMF